MLLAVLSACGLDGAVLTVDPGASTFFKPRIFNTIQAAADHAHPGDTVVIRAGIYREAVVVTGSGKPGKPVCFQPEPGAQVTICGSDPVTQCGQESKSGAGTFSFPWPYVFINNPHECGPPDNYLIGRAEQFFVNGRLQRQVLALKELSDGTFCVDRPGGKLFFRLPPGSTPKNSGLEASTRPVLWQSNGKYIEVRGLTFLHAANMAQQGAVILKGDHCSLVRCTVDQTNSVGAEFFGHDDLAADCVFRKNGQEGFSAGGAHGLKLTGCLIADNNAKGFSRQWEAGGGKVVLSRGVVISGCVSRDNYGPGLWFDIGNEACTVRNCLISGNKDSGIFYEISFGLLATDNVFIGNGFDSDPGEWGARAGITVSSSPDCTIRRNIFYGNNEGFDFREQTRTTSRIGAKPGAPEESVSNHNELFENNIVADNYTAAVWGWFDDPDQKFLPFALRQPPGSGNRKMQLRDLKIQMDLNVFAVNGKGPFYNWGPAWAKYYSYSDLALLHHQLHLEKGSILTDVPFKDPWKLNFSLPADNPAFEMGAYPKGAVPCVILGTY